VQEGTSSLARGVHLGMLHERNKSGSKLRCAHRWQERLGQVQPPVAQQYTKLPP
jgi:hypothetical protein